MVAAQLSIVRPLDFPAAAPMGRVAHALKTDVYAFAHPGLATTPSGISSIFRQAEMGWTQTQCDLFDDFVEHDCTLRNLVDQRRNAVCGKEWVMQADGQEGDSVLAAQVLGEALFELPLIDVFAHQLSFNQYGWGASEIDWGLKTIAGREWVVPIWFANVPARRFCVDPRLNELRLLTEESPTKGVPLAPGKWLITCRAGTSLARGALMRSAVWPAYFKRLTVGDRVIYGQKFGMPVVLVKYDPSIEDAGKDVAEEIAKNIGSDGTSAVPKGIEIEVHDAARTGDSSGTHGSMVSDCNRELAKLWNGSTLSNDTNDSGTGSYAHAEVHDSVRWDNVIYDAERLQEAIRTRVSAAFVKFNRLKARPPLLKFRIARDLEPMKRAEVADIYVNKLGGKLSDTQLRQEWGFVEPSNEADTLKGVPPPTPGAPPPARETA